MKAEIISIGSELMAGRIADTNAAYLSDQLSRLGVTVTRHTAVGDCREDILDLLRSTTERADVAIVTGGIGPTPDDLTRQTMAEFCGVKLVEIPEAVENLRKVFARLGRIPSESNFIQARIPHGAELIPNLRGTASGFSISHGDCWFCSLPGVPVEMKQMFRASILPRLHKMKLPTTLVRCLQVYGIGESVIGERLEDLMGENKNPQVATQAREGIITVRLTATGPDEDDALRRLIPVASEVRNRLGETVFAEEERSLSHAVAELLEQNDVTLALTESCTGGEIAARLTDVPGISRFFLEGAITYSNESKIRRLGVPRELIEQHGAVSPEAADAMALGMRKHSGATIALALTGIAGPTGGTTARPVGLVYISLADELGAVAEEARFAGDRVQIRDRAAKRALNRLRLYLIGRMYDDG